jgi:hypothetical protein
MNSISQEIKKRLERGESADEVKRHLHARDYRLADIEDGFKQVRGRLNIRRFLYKDLLDRIGYGFGSQQYINILFYIIGAPLFVVGILNGLRVFLGGIISSVISAYSSSRSKVILSCSGILVGMSFLGLAVSVWISSLLLFFISAIAGTLAIIPYGEIYHRIVRGLLEHERKTYVLNQLATYGTIITILSLFFAGFLLEQFPVSGRVLSLYGLKAHIFGYVLVFEIAALAFVASGFLVYFVIGRQISGKGASIAQGFKEMKSQWHEFSKNRILVTLLLASAATSIVNTMGNAFYGIFIYSKLMHVGFGGFVNVAVIFSVGVIAVLLAPSLTRMNALRYGNFPLLVFGTLLMAIMPLSYYYKPNLLSIAIGTLVGICGAAVVGTAQGLLTMDLLKDEERMRFFRFNAAATVLPYVIGIPMASWLLQIVGMQKFFLALSLTLCLVVAPLYFGIVLMQHKKATM